MLQLVEGDNQSSRLNHRQNLLYDLRSLFPLDSCSVLVPVADLTMSAIEKSSPAKFRGRRTGYGPIHSCHVRRFRRFLGFHRTAMATAHSTSQPSIARTTKLASAVSTSSTVLIDRFNDILEVAAPNNKDKYITAAETYQIDVHAAAMVHALLLGKANESRCVLLRNYLL